MFMWTGTNEPEGLHGNYQLVFQTVGGVPGTPVQIRFFNYPITENRENLIDGGFYRQDTWRVGERLTLNIGLRLDQFATSIPAQSKLADQFGPPWIPPARGNPNIFTGAAQSFARVDTGSWWTFAPRVGANWDLFGTGKTVIKESFGQYRVLKAQHYMIRPNIEILNATNSAAPWNLTFTSGPRFGFYNNIDTPRIARLGVIYEF